MSQSPITRERIALMGAKTCSLLADDVLSVVARERDERVSATHLRWCLRHGIGTVRTWRSLPSKWDEFEELMQALDFDVVRTHTKAGMLKATYITVRGAP